MKIFIHFIFFGLSFFNTCIANTIIEGNLCAGIEVGSRGVRWAVLETINNNKSADSYRILKDSSIITNYVSFNEKSNSETLDAIMFFYKTSLLKYNLSKSKILIGVSSGVDLAAIKENKSFELDVLRSKFIAISKNRDIIWQVLGSSDESENVFISQIPAIAKRESLLLDFGSGNVKGGFYNLNGFDELDFVPLYVNWGSSSVLKTIQKNAPTNMNMAIFYKKLDSLMFQIGTKDLTELFTSRAGFTEKRNIVFGGGISWAVNNFLMPNQSKFDFLKVDMQSLNKLRTLLKANYNEAKLNPDIFTADILDLVVKGKATEKINAVLKVYDTKALICGVEFLYTFIYTLNKLQPNPNVGVSQIGSAGWLPGFIQNNLANIY